jgi:dTDP-4-dehydrorhamnose reductase
LTKLLGEYIVRYTGLKKWLVIRTNFVAREKWPYPRAFADRYGTYLFADDVAAAIKSTLPQGLTGVVHICGEEKMSMLEIARIVSPDVKPMTFAEYSGPPLTVDMSLQSMRLKPFKITKTIRDFE